MLASADEDGWLAGLCDLLRTHTGAHVCLYAPDGKLLVEVLPQDGVRPSGDMLKLPIPASTSVLCLTRDGSPFNDDDKLMANVATSICTILFRKYEQQAKKQRKERQEAVRSAINALSFSELEAAVHIIRAIGGPEGRLVAGHTADKLGFTRSVVVNALKKLEGAGVIETRSLGVKGTHIRIKNQLLAEELNKL